MQQWLLECLAGQPTPVKERAAAFRAEPDWEELVRIAGRHGLTPLLHQRLAHDGAGSVVPERIMARLREAYLMNGVKNTLLYQELARVLRTLQQDHIPVMVLKGAHLAACEYSDPAVRTMQDIDLMVPREHLELAARRLGSMGYHTCEVPDVAKWCESFHHWPRMSKEPGPGIELHWTTGAPGGFGTLPPEDLWKRSRPAMIAGVETRVLSLEDLLLHVILHASCEPTGPLSLGLRPLCDVAAILARSGNRIDWRLLRRLACERRVDRCVYLALRLAKERLAAEVPAAALESLRPVNFQEQWLAVAENQVMLRSNGTDSPDLALALTIMRKTARRSAAENARWLLRTFFPLREQLVGYLPTTDWVAQGAWRWPVAYVTRIMTWLKRFVRLLVERPALAANVDRLRQEDLLWQWLVGSKVSHLPPPSPTGGQLSPEESPRRKSAGTGRP